MQLRAKRICISTRELPSFDLLLNHLRSSSLTRDNREYSRERRASCLTNDLHAEREHYVGWTFVFEYYSSTGWIVRQFDRSGVRMSKREREGGRDGGEGELSLIRELITNAKGEIFLSIHSTHTGFKREQFARMKLRVWEIWNSSGWRGEGWFYGMVLHGEERFMTGYFAIEYMDVFRSIDM